MLHRASPPGVTVENIESVEPDVEYSEMLTLKGDTHSDISGSSSGGGGGGRRRDDSSPDSPKISEDGWSPLGWAARKGQLGSIRLLLTHGADVNMRGGGGGSTPLIQAAMGGHLKAVQELVSAGAVDTRDESGFTAAMHAGFRHPQNAQLLGAVAEASSVSIGG